MHDFLYFCLSCLFILYTVNFIYFFPFFSKVLLYRQTEEHSMKHFALILLSKPFQLHVFFQFDNFFFNNNIFSMIFKTKERLS